MSGISSNLLKERREKILRLWEKRSLNEVPSAVTVESLALRDSLPTYLDHLSEALATNRKMDVRSVNAHDKEGVRLGRLHGADRAGNTSYVLTEVIFEYHILREVIFQVLEEEGQLPQIHRDIILDSIEQAVNDAAVKFSEVHADIQQRFINTLTHDLRTPISAAKLSAELILKRSDKPEACIELGSRIIGCMKRLNSMIDDLLDAGRVRAGELLSLPMIDCDLKSIFSEVIDEMTDLHGHRFKFRADRPVNGQWGCDGLRRAVENLIGNAVKYGLPDSPISLSLEQTRDSVRISVHNEGVPIPKEELPVLFENYRRSKSSEAGGKSGWGLGLTLVKGVADAHRGRVSVKSEEGSGTTFVIEIPQNVEHGSIESSVPKLLNTFDRHT